MRIESNPLAITGFVLAAFAAGCAADAPTAVDDAAADASLSMGGAHCENVRGTGEGNVFFGTTLTGDDPGDLLHGATSVAWLPPEIEFRGPAIHLRTSHEIDTGDLVLRTADRGIAAPIDPPLHRLNIRYEIQPSASVPEGATGWSWDAGPAIPLDPMATMRLLLEAHGTSAARAGPRNPARPPTRTSLHPLPYRSHGDRACRLLARRRER